LVGVVGPEEGKALAARTSEAIFAQEALLIGKDFWYFIGQSDQGYDTVLEVYRENAHLISDALESIKRLYLGKNE